MCLVRGCREYGCVRADVSAWSCVRETERKRVSVGREERRGKRQT
jgi:hypothetical protein